MVHRPRSLFFLSPTANTTTLALAFGSAFTFGGLPAFPFGSCVASTEGIMVSFGFGGLPRFPFGSCVDSGSLSGSGLSVDDDDLSYLVFFSV